MQRCVTVCFSIDLPRCMMQPDGMIPSYFKAHPEWRPGQPQRGDTIWRDGIKDPMYCNWCRGVFYREPKNNGVDGIGRDAHHYNGHLCQWGHGAGFIRADLINGSLCAKCRWTALGKKIPAANSIVRCCSHSDALYSWEETQVCRGKSLPKDPRGRERFERAQDAIAYLNTSDLVAMFIGRGR